MLRLANEIPSFQVSTPGTSYLLACRVKILYHKRPIQRPRVGLFFGKSRAGFDPSSYSCPMKCFLVIRAFQVFPTRPWTPGSGSQGFIPNIHFFWFFSSLGSGVKVYTNHYSCDGPWEIWGSDLVICPHFVISRQYLNVSTQHMSYPYLEIGKCVVLVVKR